MAIKIIKEGIKEFHATCPFCYCEFTYEQEDIHEGIVNCPCCGAILGAIQLYGPPMMKNLIVGFAIT